MATLELHGRVAGTAQLDVQRHASTRWPIRWRSTWARKATDLELAPLSPYAGKYAGYAIERGKLSMDVHYNVEPDGRLEASNHVVLNQLTFGDRIESPDATKLPVRLAVALLKDRNGVIDINLPVSGVHQRPAVQRRRHHLEGDRQPASSRRRPRRSRCSPAAAAKTSASSHFKPGTNTMADGAQAAIDKVAQALDGTAEPADDGDRRGRSVLSEADAIRRAELDRRVARAAAQRGPAGGLPGERARGAARRGARPAGARASIATRSCPDKPKNVLGLAKDIPVPEMEALLTKHVAVERRKRRASWPCSAAWPCATRWSPRACPASGCSWPRPSCTAPARATRPGRRGCSSRSRRSDRRTTTASRR